MSTVVMTRRLFRVRVEFDMLVAAEDEGQAELLAEESAHEAVFERYMTMWTEEVRDANGLNGGEAESLPYGDNPDDKTAVQILNGESTEEMEAEEEPEEVYGPVHWCSRCLHNRVVFDWREEEQVCKACRAEAEGAR